MKKLFKPYTSLVVVIFFLSACTEDGPVNSGKNGDDDDFTAILENYVEQTVIATYAELKDKAILLHEKVKDFGPGGLQTEIDSACQAWRDCRVPWEQSEAFLFGPAAFESLDPLLDSWPLDKAQLDQVLASNLELTADRIRDGLGAVLRGFHTIEYLLFRDGSPRAQADVTSREKEYLVAVTEVLRDDCIKLWALWHGSDGITGLEKEVLESLEVDPGTGYGYEFKTAGQPGSRYLSQKDAVDEILQGCMEIADEVGNGKIADPFGAQDTMLVESWFSWNSLTDFKNNIYSIKNSLFGRSETTTAYSLAGLIGEKDENLVAGLQMKIEGAINAIGAIPEPFRNNLDKTAKIQAAMKAVNELNDLLNDKIKPILE